LSVEEQKVEKFSKDCQTSSMRSKKSEELEFLETKSQPKSKEEDIDDSRSNPSTSRKKKKLEVTQKMLDTKS
jgi:hypothetical protein